MAEAIKVEKAELLRRIQEGYEQLEGIIAPLSEAQMTDPTVNGPWSVKDNLAHLTGWHERLLLELRVILANTKPLEFMPGFDSEDAINEQLYQQYKDRPFFDVRMDFRHSYQHVVMAVQAMTDEMLNAPAPWSTSGNPIWPLIVGNTYGHYEEHGGNIQRWLEAKA